MRFVAPADLQFVQVADCGCPEENYLYNGVDLTVHFDPEGGADAYMCWGDDEADFTVKPPLSRFRARMAVFAWAFMMTDGPPR